MRRNIILTTLFALLLHVNVIGQEERVYWNYDISHGLPTNNLYHVLIDHTGKIWFGSDYGVTSFDGSQFKTYTTEDGLLDNTVIRCYEDSLHRIWFQHVNQAPTYFSNGEIHQLDKKYSLNISTTSNFIEISKGRILMTGGKDNAYGFVEILPDLTIKLHNQKETYSGTLICLKNKVIYMTNEIKQFGVKTNYIRALFTYDQTSKWAEVGLDDKSVFRSLLYLEPNDANLIRANNIKKTYHIVKKGNRKYFATTDGLYCFNRVNKIWVLESHLLEGKTLVSIDEDKEGNLWATSINSGLYFIPKLKYSVVQLGNNQRVVYTYVHNSKIFSAGENLSFSQITATGLKPTGIAQPEKVLPGYAVPNYFFVGNRVIYTNSSNYYIKNMNSTSWKPLKTYPIAYSNMQGFQGKSGRVYFFSTNILSVFEPKAKEPIVTRISDQLGRIRCLNELDDLLYIGTQRGLFIRKSNKIIPFQKEIFNNSRITGIVTLDHFVFISTGDQGLWQYNTRTKTILQHQGALFSNVVKGIYLGENKTLWAHTNIGVQQLAFVKNKLIEKRQIDIKTTLKVNDLVNLFEIKDSLVLVTDKEFFFLPLNQRFERKKLSLHLSSFSANGINKAFQNNIKLERVESDVTFNLNCVHHSAQAISFYYRINNGPWIKNNSTLFTFSALSAGKYSFDFKAQSPFFKTAYLKGLKLEIEKKWWESNVIIFSLFALSILLVAYVVRWRITKTQERKRRTLSNELFSLQSQMNPHFTFNSLNSIQSYLSTNDKRSAQIYLADFAVLMRQIMDQAKLNLITLNEETEFLTNYINLEQRRLDNSFNYAFRVSADIDKTNTYIPTLMLQPFVENAVWHGVATIDEGGFIDISFYKNGDDLICEIVDNGPGLKSEITNKPYHKSAGIDNIKERMRLFEEIFNKKINLEIIDLTENQSVGVLVRLTIPKLSLENKLN